VRADGLAYDGFISYSHAADGKLAPALQAGLHSFARRLFQLRALRVFRDQASLAANPALWDSIEQALLSSCYLLLLASPAAAASEWVGREVECWRGRKPAENLLLIVTDGDVEWDETRRDFDWVVTTALPHELSGWFEEEPRWVDLRWARTATHVSLRNPEFRSAVADLAATLHGLPKDDLIGEDVRQHRRARRLVAATISALLALVAAAVVGAAIAYLERNSARDQTRLAISRQLAAEAELNLSVSDAEAEAGLSARPDLALLLAVRAVRLSPTPEARSALVDALTNRPALVGFIWPKAPVAAGPVVDRSGSLIAIGSTEGRVVLCHVAGRRCALPIPTPLRTSVAAVALSRDGNRVAAAGTGGGVVIIDVASRTATPVLRGLSEVSALAFSPDGLLVAAADEKKHVRIWRPDGALVRTLSEPTAPTEDALDGLAFMPTGHTLAVGSYGGGITLFDVDRRTPRREIPVPYEGGVNSVVVASDGRFATTSEVLRLWDARGHPLRSSRRAQGEELAFSADGRRLAVAAGDRLTVRNGRTLAVLRPVLAAGGFGIRSPVFAGPDVLTRADGNSVAIWAVGPRPVLGRNLRGLTEPLGAAAFSSDDRMLAGASGRVVRLWDLRDDAAPLRRRLPAEVTALTFDRAGRRLAVATSDGRIRMWRMAGTPDDQVLRRRPTAGALAFRRDGSLVEIGADGAVLRWPRGASVPQTVLKGTTRDGVVTALTGDGGRAAVYSRHTLRVVDVSDGGMTTIDGAWPSDIDSLAFDADGARLAVVTFGDARVWELSSGRPVGDPFAVPAAGVALDPMGRMLEVASGDSQLAFLDVDNHRPLGPRPESDEPNFGLLAASPGGRFAVSNWHGTGTLWYTSTTDWLARACAIVGRDLTPAERTAARTGSGSACP
jgi:WD40 repeat protein